MIDVIIYPAYSLAKIANSLFTTNPREFSIGLTIIIVAVIIKKISNSKLNNHKGEDEVSSKYIVSLKEEITRLEIDNSELKLENKSLNTHMNNSINASKNNYEQLLKVKDERDRLQIYKKDHVARMNDLKKAERFIEERIDKINFFTEEVIQKAAKDFNKKTDSISKSYSSNIAQLQKNLAKMEKNHSKLIMKKNQELQAIKNKYGILEERTNQIHEKEKIELIKKLNAEKEKLEKKHKREVGLLEEIKQEKTRILNVTIELSEKEKRELEAEIKECEAKIDELVSCYMIDKKIHEYKEMRISSNKKQMTLTLSSAIHGRINKNAEKLRRMIKNEYGLSNLGINQTMAFVFDMELDRWINGEVFKKEYVLNRRNKNKN